MHPLTMQSSALACDLLTFRHKYLPQHTVLEHTEPMNVS